MLIAIPKDQPKPAKSKVQDGLNTNSPFLIPDGQNVQAPLFQYKVQIPVNDETLIEKLNNILEESKKDKELEKEDTNGGKELEAEESDKELDRYQPVETESQASSPTEELSQASSSDVSTVAEPLEEETYIPTEDEQYQLWLEAMTPYLNEIEESVTLGQMKDIRARLSQYAADFLDSHENTSQTVLDSIDKLVISTYNTKLNYLKNPSPNPIELFQYQSRQLN